MDKKDDDLLAKALEGLGGISAGWATRFLPNDRDRLSIDVDLSSLSQIVYDSLPHQIDESLQNDERNLSLILALAKSVLQTEGELCESEETPTTFEVRGLIGAGNFNMNPALVKVLIPTTFHHYMRILIEGKAKEGLIKQHAGKKAAQRVAQQLSERLRDLNYSVSAIKNQIDMDKEEKK